MKRITNTRRRFNIKDFIKWISIIMGHYLVFAAYLGVMILIKWLIGGDSLWPRNTENQVWVFYTILLAPLLNGILHIIYDEVGSPWTRFGMWIHSFVHMILIPVFVFVFF